MQLVRFRPVEVREAELKQQYIRCLDYLMTAQRNAYYSLMQTTPSTVRRHYTTYNSSVLKFQRSWIMYTKARPRSTSNSMFLCLGKEQRKGMLQRCKCILLRLNQWSTKTRRTPRNPSMQMMEQGQGHLKRYMNGGHPSWRRDRSTDNFRMPAKQYFLSNRSTMSGSFKSLQGLVSMWLHTQPSF